MLCVQWYLSFKLSSRGLVQMMNERGIVMAHTTILRWCSDMFRSSKALESLRSTGERFMAMRRDIYKGERPLDLSLSSERQIRANCGFPAERTTGRGRCQTLLPQGNKAPWNASGDTLDAYAASHRAVRELKSGAAFPALCRSDPINT